MAITAVTVTATSTFAGGEPVANAVVSFIPDQVFSNSGTTVSVAQAAFATAQGAWTITVNATDDASTLPAGGGYFVRVVDPSTGEHIEDFRAHVPSANSTSTFAAIKGQAF